MPSNVGGEVDIMVGVKYLKYFPEQIFRLPTGLTIYNVAFNNYDGSKGVIAGPHASFTKDWEQVGQMAYSYNVRPEFPQFQAGIVVTQLEEGEILKDTTLKSRLPPTPTSRAGVSIGGNTPFIRPLTTKVGISCSHLLMGVTREHTRVQNYCSSIWCK